MNKSPGSTMATLLKPIACFLAMPPVVMAMAFVSGVGLPGQANAQEITKTCAVAEVRSVNVTAQPLLKESLGGSPERIETMPAPASAVTPGSAVTSLIVLGPVLGSMDFPKVDIDIACTVNGFQLTATITRSDRYDGTAAKNVLWQPKIEIAVVPLRSEVVAQVTWKMRLTNGVELDHAQTPPYPARSYPLGLTKTIRR